MAYEILKLGICVVYEVKVYLDFYIFETLDSYAVNFVKCYLVGTKIARV